MYSLPGRLVYYKKIIICNVPHKKINFNFDVAASKVQYVECDTVIIILLLSFT